MGRKSERDKRRGEIVQAFTKVLADHGYAGATITAVASEANLSPGLLHHHFKDKQEMLDELLTSLIQKFHNRWEAKKTTESTGINQYIDAALKLDQASDLVSAKCWVGILSEALREPELFKRVKRHLEREIGNIELSSGGSLDSKGSSAVLALILGSLVFGAFASIKVAGFAAPAAKALANALGQKK